MRSRWEREEALRAEGLDGWEIDKRIRDEEHAERQERYRQARLEEERAAEEWYQRQEAERYAEARALEEAEAYAAWCASQGR